MFRACCPKLLIISGFLLLLSCAPKTDEDQIKELMKEAGRHIEKKELSALMELLTDDYTDYRRRNKTQTNDMAQTYFNQFRGIVVHILSTRFDAIAPHEASIQTDVALSSGAARALRKWVPLSSDNYRFNIQLVKKQNRWWIEYAEWKQIGIDELFPESLSILKRLFPDKESRVK